MATEKLLELLQSDDCPLILCYGGMERLVSYLIANGVTIPVRCKDCDHYSPWESCDCWSSDPNPDDYCSRGERKTE